MIITKTCNTCEHYPNGKHCIGCLWDKSRGENSKWELKENPIVIERKVLDKIRAEIEDCKQYQFETYGIQRYFKIDDIWQIIDKYMKGDKDE